MKKKRKKTKSEAARLKKRQEIEADILERAATSPWMYAGKDIEEQTLLMLSMPRYRLDETRETQQMNRLPTLIFWLAAIGLSLLFLGKAIS